MEKADANGDAQLSFEEINDYVAEVMLTIYTHLGGPMASEDKAEL